ncbi:hypothetical protein EWM64_g8597 [Hericium alpestre]|uniref:BTB domain-containing protein n=1 Tax=Hericium alpestre TaxID=135208 RepID=A0A4Y9ZLB3_9AGAM|nr:hypothetical protein EWM64_g8597 [Hericium alpestre]
MVLTDAEDDNGIGGLGHPSVSRDEEYYFSGSADLLVFQVEDRLFRVHIAFLERLESVVFHDMLFLK